MTCSHFQIYKIWWMRFGERKWAEYEDMRDTCYEIIDVSALIIEAE